ncbi:hypothetical protein CCM_03068 [Cordyceps militaris CM01]|uniref:Uncharacterized protein n=1 Tax=Cordyceps militaris (strain CM01) TaxID=983644 RepID=G3J8L0_CORMM|nr:uncharacterized protein CCM_03068 [Cordyceps militaris CM01]EGX94797.1 hypothetical protein CCM_03068 [Cordyceps militaris CM01]
MEDPWSTPWAVDTPSASPGLPPTNPAKLASSHGGGGLNTPLDSSPWDAATTTTGLDAGARDDDDAWGGWDDGNNNTWAGAASEGFSAPWGFVDREQDTGIAADSAVSFGEEARRVPVSKMQDGVKKNPMTLLEDEQDAWTASQEMTVTTEAPAGKNGPGLSKGESIAKEDAPQPAPQTRLDKATKVQELVNMYDGIANRAVQLPEETTHRDTRSTDEAEVEEEDNTSEDPANDEVCHVEQELNLGGEEEGARGIEAEAASMTDFGIVKNITPLDDETINEKSTPGPVNEAQQNAVKEEASLSGGAKRSGSETTMINEESDPAPVEEGIVDISAGASSLSETRQDSPQTAKPDSKNPPYPIDLQHLDALFPSSAPSCARPEPVSDVIIHDSYTTTSERKTWYRVSATRPRDDADAYRRVTWAASTAVRPRTLRIVRRWMEEDSIAGRVVLGSRGGGAGGTTIGASMFNWDSSEPVVEIGELLRQQRAGHGMHRSGNGAPVTPALGSSADIPKSPWEEDELATQEGKRTSADLMPPPPAPEGSAEAAAVANRSEPARLEPASANADEEGDDEDDWGEMVSSPVVDASPAFASLSALAGTQSTPLRHSFEADSCGLDFVESPAPKPATRANPPPPIRTAGTSGVSSPMWTPSMHSPALEPLRASMDGTRVKSAVGTPVLASTPGLDVPRASTSSSRMSMERAWTPAVVLTPTAEDRPSMDGSRTQKPASPSMHTMDNGGTRSAAAAMSVSPSASRGSFEDTCTVEEKAIIDAALRSLPDLSYMLR